jgi:PAS domain S-box-containing protein
MIGNHQVMASTFLHDPQKLAILMDPERHLSRNEISSLDREILISILDSLTSGVQIVNSDGDIIYVNSSFLSIVGVKKEDRLGKKIYEVSDDGSIANVLKSGKPIFNLKNYPKGSTVELVSSAAPIKLGSEIIGVVAVVSDVNDVILLSKQLKESNSLVKKLSERISYLATTKYDLDDVIGKSEPMQKVKSLVKLAAVNEITVLLLGETGTGKELIAESIHSSSQRSKGPFVSINCSAIPENLLESEFFGHEKGSFTGAVKTKLGKFELANGGTLFLDEIGDMDIKLQSKILKAIEEKQIQRIGGEASIPLDIRIIAATNRDLKSMVERNLFRQDLFYRLNVLTINLPPLRERKDDLMDLCEHMVGKISRKIGRQGITISGDAIESLKEYAWPGNVRELENTLERVIITSNNWSELGLCDFNMILNNKDCSDVNTLSNGTSYPDSLLKGGKIMKLKDAEMIIIESALNCYGRSYTGKQEAASALGISIATLYNKIKEYRLE